MLTVWNKKHQDQREDLKGNYSRNKEKKNYWNRKLTKKAEQQIQVIKLKESEYNSKWQESLELHLSVIINKKSIPI